MNIPIFLTWVRIWLIPIFVIIFLMPNAWLNVHEKNWLGMAIFTFASLTDWLDGYLARLWKQTSAFGAFLDPVADKLLVAAALILLVSLARVPAWVAMVIIGREITISALREWMAAQGKSSSVAVAQIGRFKTAAQMGAIGCLLLSEDIIPYINTVLLGNILLYIAVILTLVSMFYYLQAAYKVFRQAAMD